MTRLVGVGVVCFGACGVLAACSPVKAGAAAVVGNHRITVSSLDTQVQDLQTAAKPYGSEVSLTAAQMPNAVLSWLIRFQVQDEASAAAGITVTQAQIDAGTADIHSQAESAASQEGISNPEVVLLSAGISPQMMPALGQYQAQELAYAQKVNGGKLPTTQAESNTVSAAITKSQCEAAKSLSIQVSPQFGRLDYSQLAVVAAPDTLSRLPGKPTPASTSGLTPAC
jgi:SurA N-terminal domain